MIRRWICIHFVLNLPVLERHFLAVVSSTKPKAEFYFQLYQPWFHLNFSKVRHNVYRSLILVQIVWYVWVKIQRRQRYFMLLHSCLLGTTYRCKRKSWHYCFLVVLLQLLIQQQKILVALGQVKHSRKLRSSYCDKGSRKVVLSNSLFLRASLCNNVLLRDRGRYLGWSQRQWPWWSIYPLATSMHKL